MAYTWATYTAAIAAATSTNDLLTIKTNMQTDMSNAGLSTTSTAAVNEWLDQITSSVSFIPAQKLMNNAGALFVNFLSLVPPESTDVVYINSPVVIDPDASTTGAVTTLTITNSANTGQTASTAIPSVLITTNSRQWATGAITTQKEVEITAPTYSFVAASTITSAYSFYVDGPPVAGTNATITHTYAAGFGGTINLGATTNASPKNGDIWNTAATGTGFTFYNDDPTDTGIIATFKNSANSLFMYSDHSNDVYLYSGTGSNLTFAVNNNVGGASMQIDPTGYMSFVDLARTSGAQTAFRFAGAAQTAQTASTEVLTYNFVPSSIQRATGAVTTQRCFYIQSPTYSFVGASTITTATSFYVSPPTAGTNATITNNYAALFNGSIGVLSDIQLGSVTTRVTSTFLQFGASTTAKSLMNLATGSAPTSPVDGDIWREDNTNTGLKIRINGVTKTITVS